MNDLKTQIMAEVKKLADHHFKSPSGKGVDGFIAAVELSATRAGIASVDVQRLILTFRREQAKLQQARRQRYHANRKRREQIQGDQLN